MDSSTAPTYDPYEVLPFNAYRAPASPLGERCYSLMHFVESEKFRGVDESYRRFLLEQEDPDDFLLETGAIDQGNVREDWAEVRLSLIRAGMWMQLVQHQESLRESLLQPKCSTGIPLIDSAAASIYQRLVEANEPGHELRRVVLAGDHHLSSQAVFLTFDHLFQNRLPDEIFVSDEGGLAQLAQSYAQARYIPIRIFALNDDEQSCAELMLEKGSHVFTVSENELSNSKLANCLLSFAREQGKKAHRFSWSE